MLERCCRENRSKIIGIHTGRDDETDLICVLTRHEDGIFTVIKVEKAR